MLTIRVKPGEEVTETVTRRLAEHGVRSGAIVSVVGAVDSCTISNMPAGDANSDILTELSQPFEMSGTGEVKDGVPHVHCVISGEGNMALAGHFHRGYVKTWFVDVYVIPSEA